MLTLDFCLPPVAHPKFTEKQEFVIINLLLICTLAFKQHRGKNVVRMVSLKEKSYVFSVVRNNVIK